MSNERKEYVPTRAVVDEINNIPLHFIDYITFSGRGEPTLALNLGEMIRAIKAARREKVAVITNGLLLGDEGVRRDLMDADFVLVKLDAANQDDFESVDGMGENFSAVIEGIKQFRRGYHGKMALQVMVLEQNIAHMGAIADLARDIMPEEVQLNTPLRPSGAKPVGPSRMEWAKRLFEGLTVVTVFDAPLQTYAPMDDAATISRHGNFRKTRSHI